MNSYFPRLFITKKLVSIYDPNNIRRKTGAKIRSKRSIIQGSNGEKFLVDLSDHIDWHLFLNGNFENICIEIIKRLPESEKWLFVDVGANFGTETIGISLTNRVTAIEPLEDMVFRLIENAQINEVPRIETFQTALVSHQTMNEGIETISLYRNEGNSGATSSRRDWNPSHASPIEVAVPITTLDAIWKKSIQMWQESRVFIKIDVEGQELEVLRGSHRVLAELSPLVIMEYRPDLLGSRESWELIEYLLSLQEFSIFSAQLTDNAIRIEPWEVLSRKQSSNILLIPSHCKESILEYLLSH